MKRIVLCLFVLLAVTGLVFAEGQKEADGESVTVFWALYDGLTEDYRVDLQDAFMAAYPDIQLDIVPVPWDQMYDKLTTSIAGGNPPELSIIGTRWALELLDMDAIVPIEDYVSDATLGFFQALLCRHEGEAFNIGADRPEIRVADLARLAASLFQNSEPIRTAAAASAVAGAPARTCPDLAKARRMLGYAPAVSLEEGLRRTICWHWSLITR